MNYSTFVSPSYVPDVFPTFSDLPASLLADAQTYQTLKLTTNLTTAQQTQLASLTTELQNYIISTSTFNAFSQAVMNMEQLILYILNFKDMGAWVSTTTYAQFNICEYNNQTFMSKQNTNLNNIPVGGSGDLYWTLIAKKGVSFRPLGTWSSATAYINDINYIDVVYSNGSSFYCIQSNTNQQPSQVYPPVNTAYWGIFSMGGAVGATGAQGLPGLNLVYMQVYNTATSYAVGNVVSFNNSLYNCINATTGNIDPTNTGYWSLFLSGTGIPISSSAPLSPAANQLWISSITKLVSYWNGTTWIPLTASAITDGTLTFAPSDIANINTESTGYGVISGLTVTQAATPNMTVNVATGTVHMANGLRFTPSATPTLAITTADVTNPRIDIVYVNSTGVVSYLAGTPAATPTVPATPTGGFLLSQISVSANATTITAANITDKRKIKNTTDSDASQITVLNGASGNYEKTNLSSFNAHLADLTAHATKANLTYYVDTTNGLDTNDGLSAGVGHAFKTIAKAISMIPQIVNHTVTINVAVGTYAEPISLLGFYGKGIIYINGGTSLATAVNFIVQNVDLQNCSLPIRITGFTANTTTLTAFEAQQCINIWIKFCQTTVTATSLFGFALVSSLALIDSCQASNKSTALYATFCSTVYSNSWTAGSGNTTGLYSDWASTIGKTGTQPQGTTAESVVSGGIIRDSFPPLQVLSGGNRVQSGSGSVSVATAGTAVSQTITFPVAFGTATNPNVVVGLAGSGALTAGYNNIVVTAVATTSFTISANSYIANTLGFYWIATGS